MEPDTTWLAAAALVALFSDEAVTAEAFEHLVKAGFGGGAGETDVERQFDLTTAACARDLEDPFSVKAAQTGDGPRHVVVDLRHGPDPMLMT
jgi:hypothetical protein